MLKTIVAHTLPVVAAAGVAYLLSTAAYPASAADDHPTRPLYSLSDRPGARYTETDVEAYRRALTAAIDATAKREGVSAAFIRAWVERESSGLPNQVRFEAHEFERLRRHPDYSHLSPETLRELATSHGPLQVMGYNAKACGMTVADLHKPAKGLACGVYHLKQWIKRHPYDSERLRRGLASYNGGYKGHERPQSLGYADSLLKYFQG